MVVYQYSDKLKRVPHTPKLALFWKPNAIIALKQIPKYQGSFTFLCDPILAGGQRIDRTSKPTKFYQFLLTTNAVNSSG
jgi:hypothetical protein